jgi:hypothetical protein
MKFAKRQRQKRCLFFDLPVNFYALVAERPKLRCEQNSVFMNLMAQAANQTINVFWTITGFAPVVHLWYSNYEPTVLFVSLTISGIWFIVPTSAFQKLQISAGRRFYERIGVRNALAITQHGALAGRFIRTFEPEYAVIKRRKDLARYKKQIVVYEAFHLGCFTFFTASVIWAIWLGYPGMAVLIFIVNIVYNIYPVLIQQYNRLRVKSVET